MNRKILQVMVLLLCCLLIANAQAAEHSRVRDRA